MDNMDKEVKSNNSKLLLVSVIVFTLLFSATFAFYTSYNNARASYNVSVPDAANLSFTLTSGSTLSLQVDPASTASYQEATSTTDSVKLVNNTGRSSITCNYYIWYQPTQAYHNSTGNTSNAQEMVIIGSESTGTNSFTFNLNGVSQKTKILDGRITASATTTQNWTFRLRHYNLNVDQSSNLNSPFGGKIYFESNGCS